MAREALNAPSLIEAGLSPAALGPPGDPAVTFALADSTGPARLALRLYTAPGMVSATALPDDPRLDRPRLRLSDS